MLGFKQLGSAAVTISGIELAHNIRKRQFDASVLKACLVLNPASLSNRLSYLLRCERSFNAEMDLPSGGVERMCKGLWQNLKFV
jgi:hypothetical protein